MTKDKLILDMLTFHNQLKPEQIERNETVIRVWLEDLEPFATAEIREAWRRTRIRAKFFSIHELVQDLLVVRRDFARVNAESQFEILLDGGEINDISKAVISEGIWTHTQINRDMGEERLEMRLELFVSKYEAKAQELIRKRFSFEEPEQKNNPKMIEGGRDAD